MGKEWKDMDKVERRIVVVIAIIIIVVLIFLFILPRLLRLFQIRTLPSLFLI